MPTITYKWTDYGYHDIFQPLWQKVKGCLEARIINRREDVFKLLDYNSANQWTYQGANAAEDGH